MSAYTHEAKYPVVNPDPEVYDCFANFNLSDIGAIVGFSAASYGVNFAVAARPVRVYNGRIGVLIGLSGGIFYSLQNSSQRLMGLAPNEAEVARYGALTKEQYAEYKRRESMVNYHLIETNKNYVNQDQIGELARKEVKKALEE